MKKEMVHNGFFLCTGCNNARLYFIDNKRVVSHETTLLFVAENYNFINNR